MYLPSGLGDTPSDITPAAYTAANAPETACDSGYSFSTILGVCVSNAGICESGYAFDPVSGVCVKSAGVMAWLNTGHNALYAGGGILAAAVLFSMMGRR